MKMFSRIVLLLLSLSVYSQCSNAATDKVVCYYSSWAIYRPGTGEYHPSDIDANICTHINYAFLGVNPNGTLTLLDEWGDIEKGNIPQLEQLKQINPNLKTIISIGGWNAGNAILAPIAASPQLRKNLIDSSLEYFDKYGFNGLDIDWEYPSTNDKQNFVTLLKELKDAFGPRNYLVTIAVSAIPIDEAYDIPGMSANVDIINLMTYDFHVAAAGVTGQNSPLYAGSADSAWQQQYENINSTVVNWLNAGADSAKLTIGLGFYGHTFKLANPSNNGLGAPVIDSGDMGPYTKTAGVLSYTEICELTNDWTRVFDDQQKNPYKFKNDQWVGYDDEQSIALKVQFAKSKNLGGVMIWTVDFDDLHEACGTKNGLLQTVKTNL